ncbi:MAG TPA: marine proteobacterial sortase target protein [Rudaea sp.]|nr:marine proteobacterial sortase target protein [Rudaea sp.]
MNFQLIASSCARRLVHVLLAVLILGGVAQAVEPGSGELRLLDKSGASHELASLDTNVDYHINGLVAEVAVHQRFRNDSGTWLEGQYLLPLPVGAAVYAMTVHIGDRIIVGDVREKQAARKVFEQARVSGHGAALVEADGSNLFRTAVTNVAPNESIEVELHYWQRVDYSGGVFSVRFPLTYTPRYRMQRDAAPASQDPGTTGPEVFASAKDEPPLSTHINVVLDAGVALASVTSPSHAIVTGKLDEQTPNGVRNVHLRDGVTVPDRDFVLQWKPQAHAEPKLASFNEAVDGANYAMLMLLPPQTQAQSLPRELILVIDTSGSMGGASITQARAALDMALRQLREQDRFNVIEFNSIMNPWRAEAVAATPGAVAQARQWVAQLQARGGTEMAAAMQLALSGHAPPGFVRQVVFATDGAVDNPAGLMALIDRNLGDSRLFPIGIGSAPNAGFLQAAAKHGRGSETVIADLHEVESAMSGLLAKLDHPAMRDLHVDWPAGTDAYPHQLPDLYLGEPMLLIARVAQPINQIRVSGMLAEQEWSSLAKLDSGRAAHGLDRLWAQARISDLEEQLSRGGDENTLRPQIVQAALTAHLVSRYTSLVAVDKTPARAADSTLHSTQVPNVLPAGSAFAQTATPARLQLLLGFIALLLAMLIWWTQRGRA